MKTAFPSALVPADDAVRLRTLHQYQISNSTPEPIFDLYVAWAALLFSTPIALISLVDEDYVHFKAVAGAEGVPGLPRGESMCSAAVLVDAPTVLTDYTAEGCALVSPDVAQAMGLAFYAGSALQLGGQRLGMLAVIGREFRAVSPTEKHLLAELAALVSQTIALRAGYLQARRPDEWADAQDELSAALDDNTALARYLHARAERIDLDDPDVAPAVNQRLERLKQVLVRRQAG